MVFIQARKSTNPPNGLFLSCAVLVAPGLALAAPVQAAEPDAVPWLSAADDPAAASRPGRLASRHPTNGTATSV